MAKILTKAVVLFCITIFLSEFAVYCVDTFFPCGIEISAIAIDPENPEIVYAINNSDLGVHIGVYKSTDNGGNWNLMSVISGSSRAGISIDSKNPQIIYVGNNKSINGGKTWNPIRNGLKSYESITKIIVYQYNTKILYSLTNASNANIVYKSINGGDSWTAIDTEKVGFCRAFAMDANNQNILYGYFESKMKDSSGKERNIYGKEYGTTGEISKSVDGGAKWTSLLPAVEITELVVDPNNPEIIYVGTYRQGVYRSLNGGKQWNTVKHGLPDGTRVSVFAFDPMNPEAVYVGTSSGLFFSADHGDNWKHVGDGLHINVSFLAINPKNPAIIYAGNNVDGIFRTTDRGITWYPANAGLPEKSCRR